MNEIGLDASAVGNHEFDKGWADLRDRVIANKTNAKWDYLGANVYQKGTTTLPPEISESKVYDLTDTDGDSVKLGVIGAVTQETPSLVSPGGISTPRLRSDPSRRSTGSPRSSVRRQPGQWGGRRHRGDLPRRLQRDDQLRRRVRRRGRVRRHGQPRRQCRRGLQRAHPPEVCVRPAGHRRRPAHAADRADRPVRRERRPDPAGLRHHDPQGRRTTRPATPPGWPRATPT